MNPRRIASLTALLSFVVLLVSSVVLYILPHGRVAYWVNWRLCGLDKDQWGALHINVGLLMIVALIVHLVYNWAAVVLYLKNKAKVLKVFTPDFNVALGLTLLCLIGTLAQWPPFSTFIEVSDRCKASAADRLGEPPYGHAELSSIKTLCQRMGFDLHAAMGWIKEAGYEVKHAGQTLKEVATVNHVSPRDIYVAMIPPNTQLTSAQTSRDPLPEIPMTGTGNLSLNELAGQYLLEVDAVVARLKKEGLEIDPASSLKQVASKHDLHPLELYGRIREAALEGGSD